MTLSRSHLRSILSSPPFLAIPSDDSSSEGDDDYEDDGSSDKSRGSSDGCYECGTSSSESYEKSRNGFCGGSPQYDVSSYS